MGSPTKTQLPTVGKTTFPTITASINPTSTIHPSLTSSILPTTTKVPSFAPTNSPTKTQLPTVGKTTFPTITASINPTSTIHPSLTSSILPTTTTYPSFAPTNSPTKTQLPSATLFFTPEVCDNDDGYAIDPDDTEGKTIKCRQKKKKLKNYCAKDFFSSVCRKKCSLCTPIVPTTNPISDHKVCDNGDGYAIDPVDTKRKQIKCRQNQKNLQNYCFKDFFSSVCRKKCALCIPTLPKINTTKVY